MVDNVREFLGMADYVVGIKIDGRGEPPERPTYFCQLVRESATSGSSFSITENDLSCPNAELILGFREPRYIQIEDRMKDVGRIRIGNSEDADIFLLILNPSQAMSLSLLLKDVQMPFSGEMGVCGEAVAKSFLQKKPVLSFLCQGARIFGGFRQNELILGIPKRDFSELSERIKGICVRGESMCGCRVSDIPKEMVKAFSSAGFTKGIDYFFGKCENLSVRIYLNKDERGRFKELTLIIPVKGEVEAKPPFHKKKRGRWSDLYYTFLPEELGIDLWTGENLREAVERLAKEAVNEDRH
jgi:uncharacterized protein (DUF169 family)